MTTNLTDTAYQGILSKIIDLDYSPGEKISEKRIEKDLNIGRTPVREAILHLKQQGLINVVPQSGTYVSLIELNRVSDALDVRRDIELSILQQASKKDFAEIEQNRLNQLIEEEKNAVKDQNISDFFKYYDSFHEIFYKYTNHPIIWNWLQSINIYFYRIIVLNLKTDQLSWQHVIETEEKILNAVINHKSDKIPDLLSYELMLSEEKKKVLIDSHPEYFDLK